MERVQYYPLTQRQQKIGGIKVNKNVIRERSI